MGIFETSRIGELWTQINIHLTLQLASDNLLVLALYLLIFIRLKTSQNLATELNLAIVVKRSFKNYVYFIYVLLNLNTVKKLQANTRLKLLTTLNMLCNQHFWENRDKKVLQKTPFLFISENENSFNPDHRIGQRIRHITGSDLNFPFIYEFQMLSLKYFIAYHHIKHTQCLLWGQKCIYKGSRTENLHLQISTYWRTTYQPLIYLVSL